MINNTREVTISKSTVFNSYINANPYRTFKTTKDDMNSGNINDTPENALILGEKLLPELWEKELRESTYGYVIANKETSFYKDIYHYDPKNKIILCRDRKSFMTVKIDIKNYEVFRVVKRSF